MFITNTSLVVRIVEELVEEGVGSYETELGEFAFKSVPAVGESICLKAFGSAYECIPENIYKVERVMHHGCHLSWDSPVFQEREEHKGPFITIFVKFISARELSEHGSWLNAPKGRLRRSEELPQKYQHAILKGDTSS